VQPRAQHERVRIFTDQYESMGMTGVHRPFAIHLRLNLCNSLPLRFPIACPEVFTPRLHITANRAAVHPELSGEPCLPPMPHIRQSYVRPDVPETRLGGAFPSSVVAD
jgi:hypothetical protein